MLYLCRMKQTDEFRLFVKEHAGDDLTRLLLSASRYPSVDVPFAVEQIASRRQIKDKLPVWYTNDALLFPSKYRRNNVRPNKLLYINNGWLKKAIPCAI